MSRDLDVVVDISAPDDVREAAGAAFMRACEQLEISVREVGTGARPLDGAFVHATASSPGVAALLSVTTDGKVTIELRFTLAHHFGVHGSDVCGEAGGAAAGALAVGTGNEGHGISG